MNKIAFFVVSVFSFLIGVVLSWFVLGKHIDNAGKAVQDVSVLVTGCISKLDEARKIDQLEISVDLIGYMVHLEERGVPRKFEGEEFVVLLNKRISELDSVRSSMQDPTATEKAEMLLDKANSLIQKINPFITEH